MSTNKSCQNMVCCNAILFVVISNKHGASQKKFPKTIGATQYLIYLIY